VRFSFRSLSFRLLLLTVGFVMLAEVLIYTPSIARFRLTYLQEVLKEANLAAQAVRVAPDGMLSEMMTKDLLKQVDAYSVVVMRNGANAEVLKTAMQPEVKARFDLREAGFFALIVDALEAMVRTDNRVLEITGVTPKDPDGLMIVRIDEAPMRAEMVDYSIRILNLSIFISILTASLVFLSLRWLMVRPLERITRSLMVFRDAPEERSSDIDDMDRRDEIGVALRELSAMKEGLRAALRQQTRLAALGIAVNKISHDLRNMLATATLISDSLAESEDPKVRKVAPTLIAAIDRAVALCSTTLNFTRDSPELDLAKLPITTLVADLAAAVAPVDGGGGARVELGYGGELAVWADRDQIHRVMANLAKNATDAGAARITLDAWPVGAMVRIDVADNGPGIPEAAHDKLFQPFAYSTRKDGTGLGLAIARDLVQAHGGSLTLARTGPAGTCFTMLLPAG